MRWKGLEVSSGFVEDSAGGLLDWVRWNEARSFRRLHRSVVSRDVTDEAPCCSACWRLFKRTRTREYVVSMSAGTEVRMVEITGMGLREGIGVPGRDLVSGIFC